MVLGLGVLGLLQGGCAVSTTCFFRTTSSGGPTDDRSLQELFLSVSVFLFVTTFFLELDELTLLCDFDPLGTLYEVPPPLFCRFFSGFFLA